MFSSSIKLLIRSQCYRSLCTISSGAKESHFLRPRSNSVNHLTDNVRFFARMENPFEDINPEDAVKEAEKKIRRKTPEIPKITLLDTKQTISVCTLEEATKIAEGRKLRLIKIIDMDMRTKRPVYKLMTEAQYLEEELSEKRKRKEQKSDSLKGDKILILSCRISENDLKMKLNNAAKWLKKNFEVRVTISGTSNSTEEQEKVFQEFEKLFKDSAKFLQKRVKDGDIKFQLMPLKDASAEGDEKNQVKRGKRNLILAEEEEEEEESVEETNANKSEESVSKQTKRNILSEI